MRPIFPELPRQLGVYTLTRLIELRQNTALYEAQQSPVGRSVVLEVLTPEATHDEEVVFLAQSRLRVASSELPHVADVYESLRVEGLWFLTQEMPQGRSLGQLAAEGSRLTVPELCNIIHAAAEMYELCGMVDLSAMPLAPSSIYIEENGSVHFLSPLVEAAPIPDSRQMQALAAALWPLLPQEQQAGLGRVATLAQWLHEGYEGEWLSWNSIGEAVKTIRTQLEDAEREAIENTPLYKVTHLPLLLRGLRFARQWGTHLGICGATVITLSCLGSLFGLDSPEQIPAVTETALLCHQGGKEYQLMKQPVTVAEYAQFMHDFTAASPEVQAACLKTLPEGPTTLEPGNWAEQQQSPAAPVTGITYWQAALYAAFRGGEIPSAQQLQLLHQQKLPFPCRWEWSSTSRQHPLPGIYDQQVYLLVDNYGAPYPVSSQSWSAPTAGFRITYPESRHP